MAATPPSFDDLGEAAADGWGGQFRQFLSQAMRAPEEWPFPNMSPEDEERARRAIAYHGCALVIADTQTSLDSWPEGLRARLLEEARMQALWEATHCTALMVLLERLDAAGVQVLVSKGTALAYSVFPNPAQRRRGDTDLLIRPEQRELARTVFAACGADCVQSGPLQEDWVIPTASGFTHQFDVHWQLSAAPALNQMLSMDEVFAHAVKLPELGPCACATGLLHTFLSDALNQAMHHAAGYGVDGQIVRGAHRLIWSYGIALQVKTFTQQNWNALSALACDRGAALVCASALERAQRDFGAEIPDDVSHSLAVGGENGAIDHYLFHAGAWDRLRANWSGAASWAVRCDVVRNSVFPHSDFLRRKYPEMASWPLPILHMRRIVEAPFGALRARKG